MEGVFEGAEVENHVFDCDGISREVEVLDEPTKKLKSVKSRKVRPLL